MTQKSFLAKPGQIQQKWYEVDASEAILGRLAVDIARVLMGKHKPEYTPHVDVGDYVIVTNAAKLRVNGDAKKADRLYDFFSGYPSGLRRESLGEMLEKKPVECLRLAVRRMLPKNTLGRHRLRKLKIVAGDAHEHQAQQPQAWPFEVKKFNG